MIVSSAYYGCHSHFGGNDLTCLLLGLLFLLQDNVGGERVWLRSLAVCSLRLVCQSGVLGRILKVEAGSTGTR